MRKSGLTGDEAYVLAKRGKTTEDLGPLKKEIGKLKEEIADKATLENGVVKFWKSSTEESRTDTLLYSVDISSIGGTGGLDLENLTLSVSQVGNYQRLSMSDGTTTKNVDIPITAITDEQVSTAVQKYLEENPVSGLDASTAETNQVPVADGNGNWSWQTQQSGTGSEETDPTVPNWAKQPNKPTYTADEVGALPDTTKIPSKTSDLQNDSGFLTEHQDLSGYALKSEVPKSASDVGADAAGTAESKVFVHNTATDSHNDIRELISGLTQRLNALSDSDDETLDQMSEVVAYIKSNKSLIDVITTSKINVSDIIDNLTTNVSNKPLSAAQGVALKALIDAITSVELDETLTDNTKAAPAGMVGKLKSDKINTSDIIDNLTTDDNSKVLSAAQGVTLKSLVDKKVELPKDNGGNILNGTSGQILQSNGDGTTRWVDKPTTGTGGIAEETDPTVPEWAKQPTKPTYTAHEVGALPDTTKIPSKTSDLQNDSGFLTQHQDLSGYALKSEIPNVASDIGAESEGTAESKVSAHNVSDTAHNDIRLLVQGLTERLNALADSDDTTLDQMSEVVAYIKSNKNLIDAITTSKINVSDIIDNLTTNVSNKPLSAAQGVILKTMIDEITIPEKLPNPYSLTFTGAVAGIYNGSEALTINIPSGGDGSTYYVTPEQFGAIGDGVTNDSEAFRQAIETEKPIVCTYGKKYNCITEIVTEKTTINIIGNRCMLKNFHLKINVNSGETSWINAYPVPNSTIQDVNFNGTDKPEYCIKTGIPIKFLNCKWNFYDIMVKNYGSYMDYIVFENCAFKNHSGTHYAIDLAYLGDQHVFRECDFGGTGENRKFVSLSGCQSATIINCLFAGDHIIYSSNVVFIGCHMEGVSSITVGGHKTWDTILHFIDCYFWDMYTLSLAESSSFFDSCTFYISHQCIVGGRDYTSYNQKNCKILCATTSDPNSYVNLDDLVNRKEFPERKALSNKCVHQSSAGAVAQGRNWPLNTGSYTYLFFPSTNPYSIDGWNFYYTKATLTFEISSDSSIVSFTGNSDFAGYYLWCYRTSPDGTIHRAIMPMHMDRFYDYGQYMNGIPWVEVDAIPDPKTSLATFKNGIYYSGDGSCNGKNCMCINTSNGIISYISEDGVVHKNEYVDASEVMY